VLVVPAVVGLYYVDAQAILRAAGFCVDLPTWVLSPVSNPYPLPSYPPVITADSNAITADSPMPVWSGYPPVPLYVTGQSIAPDTVYDSSLSVIVRITVIGYPALFQPNTLQAVP
jgi:hypothetical protein